MRGRVTAFLDEMHRDHTGDHVVAVSHGAAIRACVAAAFGVDHARRDALAGPSNASVTTLAIHDHGRSVVSFNLPAGPDDLAESVA